jgi:hypothetical protein
VRLEVGADGVIARHLFALVADARQLFAHRLPSVSFAAYAVSSEKAPQNTPEPIITGTKREPSSLVQKATSMGASS